MAHDSNAENLRAELKSLADTLEEVLNSSTDKPKAELEKLRSKAEGALKETRARLSDAGDKLASQTKQIAGQADDYVRDNPWTGIGIGAAVGDVGVAKFYIKTHPEKAFKLVPDAKFERQYFGIAVAKGNDELRNKINAGLKKIVADGTYAKIYQTWFDSNVPTLPAE